MTADDFYLLLIAFGGFVILALVLWSSAHVVDRRRESTRSPRIRHDIDSPDSFNGHGRKQRERSDRGNNLRRRFAGWAAAAMRRVEHLNGAVGKAESCAAQSCMSP